MLIEYLNIVSKYRVARNECSKIKKKKEEVLWFMLSICEHIGCTLVSDSCLSCSINHDVYVYISQIHYTSLSAISLQLKAINAFLIQQNKNCSMRQILVDKGTTFKSIYI